MLPDVKIVLLITHFLSMCYYALFINYVCQEKYSIQRVQYQWKYWALKKQLGRYCLTIIHSEGEEGLIYSFLGIKGDSSVYS